MWKGGGEEEEEEEEEESERWRDGSELHEEGTPRVETSRGIVSLHLM